MVFYSKLFTCPFHSLHFSFGFQRLPSRLSWPNDLLGPSFHSLPSYDLLRSCALPSVLDVLRLPYISWYFTASFSPAPSIAYIFHLGFNVYLPGILGLLIRLVLAFTMIYYAAVHYAAFLDVLRLLVFYGKLFTCPFHSLHFSLGFKVYLPGFLGLLICLVLAFTRHQALIYYARPPRPRIKPVWGTRARAFPASASTPIAKAIGDKLHHTASPTKKMCKMKHV